MEKGLEQECVLRNEAVGRPGLERGKEGGPVELGGSARRWEKGPVDEGGNQLEWWSAVG